MNLKSNVVMEHLQIYGVLWCDEKQTKTFKRTSTTHNKLLTCEQIKGKLQT